MKKKISKKETLEKVHKFFKSLEDKDEDDVKKIKRLVMSKNIPLKKNRKKFCKKCLKPYKAPKTRIKNKIKIVTCENCGHISRWKAE